MSEGVFDGTGIILDSTDLKKVEMSLEDLKKKHRRNLCRYCLCDIEFIEDPNGKGRIPHDLDGTPHWKSCLAGTFKHKKASLKIAQKFGIYFLMKHGIDLESEVHLTEEESKMVHYMVERALKSFKLEVKPEIGKAIPVITEEAEVKIGLEQLDKDVVKAVEAEDMVQTGDDPIGDPDEELAAPEELIKKEE